MMHSVSKRYDALKHRARLLLKTRLPGKAWRHNYATSDPIIRHIQRDHSKSEISEPSPHTFNFQRRNTSYLKNASVAQNANNENSHTTFLLSLCHYNKGSDSVVVVTFAHQLRDPGSTPGRGLRHDRAHKGHPQASYMRPRRPAQH